MQRLESSSHADGPSPPRPLLFDGRRPKDPPRRVADRAAPSRYAEQARNEARVAEALISKNPAYCKILLAIANDDAEAVAKLATNELKAGKLTFDRCPEPIWGMAGLGIVCMYGDTPYGLQLGSGQTLLDIARSNNKQAAAAALLP